MSFCRITESNDKAAKDVKKNFKADSDYLVIKNDYAIAIQTKNQKRRIKFCSEQIVRKGHFKNKLLLFC